MILTTIEHDNKSFCVPFPYHPGFLQVQLDMIGIRQDACQIPTTTNPDEPIQVKFVSDSEADRHLISLFRDQATLADANAAAHILKFAGPAIKEVLERKLIADEFHNLTAFTTDYIQLRETLGNIRASFYFPLVVCTEDENLDLYELPNSYLRSKFAEVEDAIEAEQKDCGLDMSRYFTVGDDPFVKDKLVSMAWHIEERKGVVYGRVDVGLRAELDARETQVLKDWILGQNSDGFGEGFEQRPISTADGDLYISFWNPEDDYFIMTREEFDAYLELQNGLSMGGM